MASRGGEVGVRGRYNVSASLAGHTACIGPGMLLLFDYCYMLFSALMCLPIRVLTFSALLSTGRIEKDE